MSFVPSKRLIFLFKIKEHIQFYVHTSFTCINWNSRRGYKKSYRLQITDSPKYCVCYCDSHINAIIEF